MSLSPETIDKVISFSQDDNVSRMMPGKADYVSIRDENSNKVHKQKRHLVMTIAETYQRFAAENPEEEIGKSMFASLRPKWVLLCSEMPQNVYGCKYHENVILLLDSLHKKFPDVMQLYSKQAFTTKCVCDINSEICMSDNSETCSDGKLFDDNFQTKSQEKMNLNGVSGKTNMVLFKIF